MSEIISLDEQIKTERVIKLVLKRILNDKRFNDQTRKAAQKALDVAKHNEQQYLAQSKQTKEGLRTDGNSGDGEVTQLNAEKVFVSRFLSARGA